ncbi:MAG TPA: TIGR00300 family protein [Vicinamibacterales bacterium]|nr:TIGR00300 family protein [Vicinamibacterales bacterium]
MTPGEILEAEGHLVDSDLLAVMFDRIVARGGAFEVLHFELGRTNEDYSRLRLRVTAPAPAVLAELVEELVQLGCRPTETREARLRPADLDGCAPEDFYSTTNQRTEVRIGGRWVEVEHQRMDAAIVVEGGRARCRRLRDLRRGDQVVCGLDGIRVFPEFRPRDRFGFAFMSTDVSSERRVEVAVARVAEMMRETRQHGRRIVVVAGPVVVHTGGAGALGELVRLGHVDALLAGNALAVHDVEAALFGTSLGVDLQSGLAVEGGHRHHMRAINLLRRAGGIEAAVAQGVLRAGVMYECVRRGVPYALAGSIRDDGPLPETIMDLERAQDRYAELLEGAGLVLVLGSSLHGIGAGNMLPAWVRMVAVDINPAAVTKLADRGSSQTIGVVTDVGLFLHHLVRAVEQPAAAPPAGEVAAR